MVVRSHGKVDGTISVPGDKSISHRLLMLSAIARGTSHITNCSPGVDVNRTLTALRSLGVEIGAHDKKIIVRGTGGTLCEPSVPLNCGNSGTTARLLCGLLAPQPIVSFLYGDISMQNRPMDRVVQPLIRMGARLLGRDKNSRLPIAIKGGNLEGMTHELAIPSAQVKSALLIAGLFADGVTTVIEPRQTRDHTERLLRIMEADIKTRQGSIAIKPSTLAPINLKVPGDFSSAAFFITLAILHKKARLSIKNVNLNPTRLGFLFALQSMGARITIEEKDDTSPEPVGTIQACSSELRAISIGPDSIPSMIDELPLLALTATQAEGTTVVTGAGELRAKESDRIKAIVWTLRRVGARIEELRDGFSITGPTQLRPASFRSFSDHRIVMMQTIAAALIPHPSRITGQRWAEISYPTFFEDLARVTKR